MLGNNGLFLIKSLLKSSLDQVDLQLQRGVSYVKRIKSFKSDQTAMRLIL